MSKKSIAFLLLLFILPIIIYFLWPSDEVRIRKLIREGAAAIEREELDAVMQKVNLAYRDDYGLNYIALKRFMSRWFETTGDIDVSYERLRIDIKDRTATAVMYVRVAATAGGGKGFFIGDPREPERLKLSLVKERTRWSVIKSEGVVKRIMDF